MKVANNLVGEKAKQEAAFWQIFNERCPHKGVLFDKIDTNCGIVNSVYLSDMDFCMPYDLFVKVCFLTGGGGFD